MALTWQNVAAPDFSGSIQAQKVAGDSMNNGFGAIQAALASFEQNKINQAKMADDQRRALLGDQTIRLGNTGLEQANSQEAWKFQNTKAYEAARPAAVARANEIRSLAALGTPEGKAKALELQRNSADVFAATGWTPADVNGQINGNIETANSGLASNNAFQVSGDANIARGKNLEAEKLAASAMSQLGDSAAAAEQVRNNPNLSPDLAAAAIAKIAELGKSVDQPAVDPQSLIMDQRIAEQSANPLVGLVDRTEGAGKYNTLFGHAQDKNTPFAGVDVTKMSLDQLTQLDGQYGPWVKQQLANSGQTARIATPMGRFQIVGDTRRQVAKEMGLSGDTVFDANTQNAMFNHLVDKRISGPRTMDGKLSGLRAEWEGFKNVSDAELSKAVTAYESGDKSAFTNFTQSSGDTISAAMNQANVASNAASAADAQQANTLMRSAADSNQALLDRSTQAQSQAQTFLDQVTAGNAFNQDEPLVDTLVNRPDAKLDKNAVINKLHKEMGDQDGLTVDQVADEVNMVMDNHPGMGADMAAAFLKNNIGQTTWGVRFAYGNRSIYDDKMEEQIKRFYGTGAEPTKDLQGAVAKIQEQRMKQESVKQLADLTAQVEKAKNSYFSDVSRKNAGRTGVNADKSLKRYQMTQDALDKALGSLKSDPRAFANIKSKTGL